jgi:cysteinyl-tRNA synthetase
VAVDAHKKNPGDFVLWKSSSADEPGWDSPWGRGRPGWHIECSAMSSRYLGEVFDIHGGGLDLIFPHHENEIAQSRCCFGTDVMANVWMHNGFLQVEGQKMSKSLGNFVTIADVLLEWPGEVARLNMLRTHYRQPLDWTKDSLTASQKMLTDWNGELFSSHLDFTEQNQLAYGAFEPNDEFVDALTDDLNTHAAFTVLHKIAKSRTKKDIESFYASLNLVGLIDYKFMSGFKFTKTVDREKIVRLIEDRLVARHTKNWKESDRIRDELDAMGIAIVDHKDGTTSWEVKR